MIKNAPAILIRHAAILRPLAVDRMIEIFSGQKIRTP
jgi:hypothetical protein